MTMGLEALGLPLAGIVTVTMVKTEYGAKRNSYSPATLLFSTKFTCLQRYLRAQRHDPPRHAWLRTAHLSEVSPRGSAWMIQ